MKLDVRAGDCGRLRTGSVIWAYVACSRRCQHLGRHGRHCCTCHTRHSCRGAALPPGVTQHVTACPARLRALPAYVVSHGYPMLRLDGRPCGPHNIHHGAPVRYKRCLAPDNRVYAWS